MAKPRTKKEIILKLNDLAFRYDRRKNLKKKEGYLKRMRGLMKQLESLATEVKTEEEKK